ncbi:MAG: endonuclease/exonuclease/phosphatase family protein [candidate division WOR-3 bacterium]
MEKLPRLFVLIFLGCTRVPAPVNRAPTVVITSAPVEVSDCDSARFCWQGSDPDGAIAGYYYWLDDSTVRNWTRAHTVTFHQLAYGIHLFGVQAVDDSGKGSFEARAAFRVSWSGGIPVLGTDTTFEIITWNIQNFPKARDTTLNLVALIISRLDADIYCIQEIEDTLAFIRLLNQLNGYQGFFSADDYGQFYQKTGVIYKRDIMDINGRHQIFWNNDSFPRPPLVMNVRAHHNGREFDFRLVVLHLKAGSGYYDRLRRAGACRQLKGYLDSVAGAGGESGLVVAGDWNDRLDAPAGDNVFLPLLADSLNYRFLTLPLAGNSYYSSIVGSDVLFDHILISAPLFTWYAGGRTVTVRLDDFVSGYPAVISDHRPVMATFPIFR